MSLHTLRLRTGRGLRSFTLLEVVVVLAILVILAGSILVKLDVIQLRANKGVAASDMAGVSRILQTYTVTNNHYPDGYDSLVDLNGGTAELYGSSATLPLTGDQATLDPQLIGLGTSDPVKLALTTIANDGEVRSLTRMGITTLYDVDSSTAPTGFPSDRFTLTSTIAVGTPVAELNSLLNDATVASPEGDADAIMQRFYPQTNGVPPSGTRVLVFGLGPLCTLVGRSGMLQSAPLYANSADRNRYYARELVCFEVSDGGSRARFLGALGADADRLDEELTEFYELQ